MNHPSMKHSTMGCQQPCLQYQIQLIIVAPKSSDTSGNSPCIFSPKPYSTQLLKYNMQYDMPSGFKESLVLNVGNEGMIHFIVIFMIIPATPSNPSIPCVHHPGCSWCQTSLLRWPHCTWPGRNRPGLTETQNTWGYRCIFDDSLWYSPRKKKNMVPTHPKK